MDPFFFRVEHDLLRSESFKNLGGSAIKVYLTIGLYADFGSDWAYPSIRTIAKQAGLSRQTVLAAIAELTKGGLLATSKSPGRSTAYKIIRQAPVRPAAKKGKKSEKLTTWRCPRNFRSRRRNSPKIFRRYSQKLVQSLYRPWPNSSAPRAARLGPNKKQEREKTAPRAWRFRARPFGSPPRAGCWLPWIYRNCSQARASPRVLRSAWRPRKTPRRSPRSC